MSGEPRIEVIIPEDELMAQIDALAGQHEYLRAIDVGLDEV